MKSIVALLLLIPSVAIAAGGGGHAEGPPSAAQWTTLIFTGVNFALFVFLITRFARNPLRDYLVTRRKELVEAMSAASRAKEEAERIKAEYEGKVAQLDKTRQDLIAEVRSIAEADRKRALEAATKAGERLKQDAERTAQSDLERARRELRGEAAALAAEIAAREVASRLDDDGRRRLVREFIEKVERT